MISHKTYNCSAFHKSEFSCEYPFSTGMILFETKVAIVDVFANFLKLYMLTHKGLLYAMLCHFVLNLYGQYSMWVLKWYPDDVSTEGVWCTSCKCMICLQRQLS